MALALTPPPLPLAPDEHGVVRVAGTRVTLDTIIDAYKQGRSAEEIAQDYPSVPKSAIYATIAYYLSAQEDVDAYLRARQDQAERVRAEVEQWSPSTGLRQRLLERRKASRSEPTRQAPGGSPGACLALFAVWLGADQLLDPVVQVAWLFRRNGGAGRWHT